MKRTFLHKWELALMYFPAYTPEVATHNLRQWIRESPELLNQLRETGYSAKQKVFTTRQVDIILTYFGTP